MTSTPTCPICDRPIVDTGYLCHACADSLRDTFVQIARLHHQLDVTYARRDRIGDPGKTNAEPLPWSQKAAEARYVVGNVITTWARHVEDERGTRIPGQHRPPRPAGPTCKDRRCGHDSCAAIDCPVAPTASTEVHCALWLSTQVDWIRHRAEADQIHDEIHDAATLLTRTIDRTPPRQYVGPCDICGADMYAHEWASEVRCPKGCDVIYTISDRREWLLEKVEDRLASAAQLARSLTDLGQPIKSSRIRKWASRGRLVPRGIDEAGRALYAVRDVQNLLREDERQRDRRTPRPPARHTA